MGHGGHSGNGTWGGTVPLGGHSAMGTWGAQCHGHTLSRCGMSGRAAPQHSRPWAAGTAGTAARGTSDVAQRHRLRASTPPTPPNPPHLHAGKPSRGAAGLSTNAASPSLRSPGTWDSAAVPPFAPFSSALGTLRGPPRRGAPGGQRAFTTTSTTSIVTTTTTTTTTTTKQNQTPPSPRPPPSHPRTEGEEGKGRKVGTFLL